LYDPSREGNGVKIGVMSSAPKAGKKTGLKILVFFMKPESETLVENER
jgi:hypothetical protein